MAEFHGLDETMRLEFEATKDPRVLWSAYQQCRLIQRVGGDAPVPEWVFAEFDAIALRLAAQCERGRFTGTAERRHWTRAVAEIFGFHAPIMGGPTDPFKRSKSDNIWLAERVRVLVDGDGLNQTDACYLVSNKYGVAEATVRRAWKQFAVVARSEDIDSQRYRNDHDDKIAFSGEIPNSQ
jgi:hypothetical protein